MQTKLESFLSRQLDEDDANQLSNEIMQAYENGYINDRVDLAELIDELGHDYLDDYFIHQLYETVFL